VPLAVRLPGRRLWRWILLRVLLDQLGVHPGGRSLLGSVSDI